jgi:isopentenyldiphosphate isomerase
MTDAIGRRARRELGLTVRDVELVVAYFRYRAVDATGIVENEVPRIPGGRRIAPGSAAGWDDGALQLRGWHDAV